MHVDRQGTIIALEGEALRRIAGVDDPIGRPAIGVFGEGAISEAIRTALSGRAAHSRAPVAARIYEVCAEPRRTNGHSAGAVLALFDITDATNLEDEALEHKRQVELIFQHAPGGIWATDRALTIVRAAGRTPGLSFHGVVGKTIYDVVGSHEPTDPVIAHHLAALAGQKTSFRHERDGHSFEVMIEPTHDDAGDIDGCVAAAVEITERQVTEERLALREVQLAEAQRIAHIGSWTWRVDENRVIWSDELYRIYGLTEFAGTFEAFLRRVHPADREAARAGVLDALRRGGPFEYDHRIVRPDGSIRVLHTRGAVTSNGNERVRMSGSCWDVTDQIETTTALARTVSQLGAALDATADGLLIVDAGGRITAQNQRFVQMWHIPADLAAKRDDDLLLQYVAEQVEDPDLFLLGVRDLYNRPDAESFDVLHFKDGRVFERYSRPQAVGGELTGRVWSFRDVTERERLYRRAVFLADASRLLTSLDVEKALPAVARLAVPVLGDACAVDMLSEGGARRLVAVSRDPQRDIQVELTGPLLAGHAVISGEKHMAVPLAFRGRTFGVLTLVAAPQRRYTHQDLEFTEEVASRIALAYELGLLYREAQDALTARDNFLSIAAHEIRGPLTGIRLAVQWLQGADLGAPERDKAMRVIERENRRLAHFVDELLDLGRIRSGRLHFDFKTVDLATIVREVCTRLGPELAAAGSAFTLTIQQPVVGTWDASRVDQVVSNLLANAIKFGLGKPIEVALTVHEGSAVLKVTDQGVGIPETAHERIFHPFEQVVPPRQYGGLGLGLYIVRTLVEGLGGSISVDSAEGQGATFTVELPLSARVP